MTKAELYGGPFDGRQVDVPRREPLLRMPVVPTYSPTGPAVLIARYVRCDHLNGSISYRYQGEEPL